LGDVLGNISREEALARPARAIDHGKGSWVQEPLDDGLGVELQDGIANPSAGECCLWCLLLEWDYLGTLIDGIWWKFGWRHPSRFVVVKWATYSHVASP
jgi:hypothetical protein